MTFPLLFSISKNGITRMKALIVSLAFISMCSAADIDFDKIDFIGVGDYEGQKGVPHQSLKLIRQTGQAAKPDDPKLEHLGYASVNGERYRLFVSDVRPSGHSEENLEKYKGDADKFDLYKFGYFAGVRTALKANKGQFIAQAFGKSDDVQPWVDGYNDAIGEIQNLR
jgi:hypothetical protein